MFTLLWSGVIWFMVEAGAPVMFAIFFGLVDLLLIAGCVGLWLGSTRTLIDGRSITVRSGVLGIGTTRTIQAEEIEELYLHIGMQGGRTPYYDLVVKYGREKAVLGSSVKSKREAERLLEEMKRCLPRRETVAV